MQVHILEMSAKISHFRAQPNPNPSSIDSLAIDDLCRMFQRIRKVQTFSSISESNESPPINTWSYYEENRQLNHSRMHRELLNMTLDLRYTLLFIWSNIRNGSNMRNDIIYDTWLKDILLFSFDLIYKMDWDRPRACQASKCSHKLIRQVDQGLI